MQRISVLAAVAALTAAFTAEARPTQPSHGLPRPKPEPAPAGARAAVPVESGDAEIPPVYGPDAIGSISVGHPHVGFLFNAVRMPKGKEWVISVPQHAYGTEETIRNLILCIRKVHEQFPDSPPVFLGSISPEHGGPAPPHISHRTGRDVDVYFYRTPGTVWYTPASADDLDRARTWALLKAFVTLTDVEFVLIDQSVQDLLEQYALSIGEEPEWVHDLFHGDGTYQSNLIKHVPGHREHMHVRFVSPIARERGRRSYDRLVEQGYIARPVKEVRITVAKGDSLASLAGAHHASAEALAEKNHLTTRTLKPGQVLLADEQGELHGARDPIVVPKRRLPGRVPSELASTAAALDALDRTVKRALQASEHSE